MTRVLQFRLFSAQTQIKCTVSTEWPTDTPFYALTRTEALLLIVNREVEETPPSLIDTDTVLEASIISFFKDPKDGDYYSFKDTDSELRGFMFRQFIRLNKIRPAKRTPWIRRRKNK